MSKRPKLAYHQRTTANKTSSSDVVVFEYTGRGRDHVPNNVTHVRIHPSITKIEDWSFYDRRRLKEVVLNEGLTVICSYAFSNCSSLPNITLPFTVIEIDQDAFNSCTNLREVVLNEGLQKIENSAFIYCTSLASITLPSTVIEIGKRVFDGCGSLREVLLNEGIKKVKEHAFQNCRSLQCITLPSTISKIDDFAFIGCNNLREVVLHNEEVHIDDQAFYNCTSLESFKFPNLSTRLDNIIQAGQRDIDAKMDDISAIEWRSGELIIPSVRREIEEPWGMEIIAEIDYEKLYKIVRLIRYYEIKEATTLFELAVWKAQIDISNPTNREACRVDIPGPVKDTILQYIG